MRLHGTPAAMLVIQFGLVPVDEQANEPIEVELESGRILVFRWNDFDELDVELIEPPDTVEVQRLALGNPRECGYCHAELAPNDDVCDSLLCHLYYLARRSRHGRGPRYPEIAPEVAAIRVRDSLENYELAAALT